MATEARKFRLDLRTGCMFIGYMFLIASVVDIVCHIAIVGFASNAFQCDITIGSLKKINLSWLEPVLFAINLGTHGFYEFPMILRGGYNSFVGSIPTFVEARCYPAVLHVQLMDIFYLMINLIWFKYVKSYVKALHKKDPESMCMFIGISLVKFALQILFLVNKPDQLRALSTDEVHWFIQLLDINLAGLYLLLVYLYMRKLKSEKVREEQPPPYIECLVDSSLSQVYVTKDVKKETELIEPKEKPQNVTNTTGIV